MSLFQYCFNLTKCHFLIGGQNYNYHFMAVQGYEQQAALDSYEDDNSFIIKPIKK